MTKNTLSALALAAGVLTAWPQVCQAIAARPDRPESLYVAHAADLAAVGSIVGLFTGTLVAPEWVLTAAHGAEMLQSMVPDPDKRVIVLAGTPRHIAAIHVPEGRVAPESVESEGDTSGWNGKDIALLKLTEPVRDVRPARIYDGRGELAAEVTIAGTGTWCANGAAGTRFSDAAGLPRGTLRAGTNRIDRVDTTRQVIETTFDNPAEGRATHLECGLGVGDSGGPLLLATPSGPSVVGVISACEVAADGIIGRYGDRIAATRVSAYADWIARTLAGDTPAIAETTGEPTAAAESDASGSFAWPNTEAGRRARAYFEAFNAEDDGPMRAFIPIHWSPEALEKRSAEERLAQNRAPHQQFGNFTPVAIETSTEWAVTVVADAEKAPFRMAFTFELSPEPPHYATKTRIRPAK